MRILADRGHHSLKMSTLCKMLNVTTGSFYNYFGNWANFVTDLLEYWEKERTDRIAELSSRPADPSDRVRLMKELAIQVPHGAEIAIRAWSNGDPIVAEFQRRVDHSRFEALRTLVRDLIDDEAKADLLSVMGISLLIGMQSWRSPVDIEELHRVFDEFEGVITRYADNSVH
ncbi:MULTISPECIES: TetR/AcrR family transcriptional regulator [Nocardia]|uniref:TetR/AcrR family transcriptional regulator n=1 Tax=Nocardia TaxID=1817 RepID=UPI0022B848B6|nr:MULTISPECIES: TetR/AcrR family transcriptional regulator [Nocardia]